MAIYKLFYRGFTFILLGWLLVYELANLAEKTSPDSTSMFLRIDQRHVNEVINNSEKISAIVVGNSHGDNIDFGETDYTGFQLSRAWGDLFEIKYYLDYFVPRLPELEAVFIPISYFTFTWDNASVKLLNVRRSQMYTVIPEWYFIEGDIKNFVSGRGNKVFPIEDVLRQDNWKGVFYSIVNGSSGSDNLVTAQIEGNCEYKSSTELVKISQERVNETILFAEEIRSRRPDIYQDTYLLIEEIIRYLQQQDIRIILFTPPYYEAYSSHFFKNDPEGVEIYRTNMERLQNDYGVEYYDYSLDERFVQKNSLFFDSDHLNPCGKRFFTKLLLDDMLRR